MDSAPLDLEFDLGVYRLSAIKKAAYKFAGVCHVSIENISPERARVRLTAKRVMDNVTHLAGEFQNEVLDQDLRETISAETRTIRELLLAQAFSATTLLVPDADTVDYRQDPLGIAQPDGASG